MHAPSCPNTAQIPILFEILDGLFLADHNDNELEIDVVIVKPTGKKVLELQRMVKV